MGMEEGPVLALLSSLATLSGNMYWLPVEREVGPSLDAGARLGLSMAGGAMAPMEGGPVGGIPPLRSSGLDMGLDIPAWPSAST